MLLCDIDKLPTAYDQWLAGIFEAASCLQDVYNF